MLDTFAGHRSGEVIRDLAFDFGAPRYWPSTLTDSTAACVRSGFERK